VDGFEARRPAHRSRGRAPRGRARRRSRIFVEALRAAAARAAEDDVALVVELVDDTPAIERLKRKLRPPLGPIADVIVVGPSTHRRLHG